VSPQTWPVFTGQMTYGDTGDTFDYLYRPAHVYINAMTPKSRRAEIVAARHGNRKAAA